MNNTVLLSNGLRLILDPVKSEPDTGEPKNPRTNLERVNNVWGSSAGAGSDFFHRYRKQRALELDRLEQLEKEFAEEQLNAEFQLRRETKIIQTEKKREKKALKRRNRKAKLQKKLSTKRIQNQ